MYNKKQMEPLIAKFAINPETNKLFIRLTELFEGQPNYQIWAVKTVFSKTATYDDIMKVKDWADKNQSSIVNLTKRNIVSYTTKKDFANLLKEIDGLDAINLIKNTISCFNTNQRKLLNSYLFDKEIKATEFLSDPKAAHWYFLFKKFSKLPMARRNNVIVVSSSFKHVEDIEEVINSALSQDYSWNKEDMLAFLENNTQGCEVVFNSGDYVIVRVGNFDASKKLCGGGRTQWCITKKDSFFKDYTSSGKRDQYFLFDFSRKETDCFAHIGFTIENGKGLVFAQTCDNKPMINEFVNGNERLSFKGILEKIGANMSIFMRLRGNFPFEWDVVPVIEELAKYPEDYAIALEKDDILVVNVMSQNALRRLVGHTYIDVNDIYANSFNKIYVVLDFTKKVNTDKSIVCLSYRKDQYGDLSLSRITDIFNNALDKENYFKSVKLSQDEYIDRENIDPRILLHKYIDERDEMSAIRLIEAQGNGFDVNYEFNDRIPIFSTMSLGMTKLFEKIVNHPQWDSSITDGFGETLLESLIYLNGSDEITKSKEKEEEMNQMIRMMSNSDKIDFNAKNYSMDTAINVAVEFPKMTWLVEILVSNPKVDVNIVNECDCSPLTTCIRKKNLKALSILGQRPDLKVRDFDRQLANQFNITLENYIKPNKNFFKDKALQRTKKEVVLKDVSLESIMVEA